ncbi:MAG: hypothetical protein AABX39_06820 [Nanoarchaeota archaeon]
MSKINRFDTNKICICLVVVLLAVLLANVYLLNSIQQGSTPQEKVIPPLPKIEIYALIPDSCSECFDIATVLPQLAQSTKANVTKQEVVNQKDAGLMIKEYGVKTLPTVIIKGEIDNTQLSKVFVRVKDALVAKELPPPYFDLESSSVKGKVKMTLIESDCKECTDISFLGKQLSEQAGVFFEKQENLKKDSSEAKELIKKYSLKSLPAAIFSQEISAYTQILPALESIATKESDGNYVLRNSPPPYYELASNKVVGLVDASFVESSACEKCLAGEELKDILSKILGLKFKNARIVDSSSAEGKDILRKYSIEKIPTAIISEEAKVYPSMKEWAEVGSVEKDGKYVFRELEILGNAVEGKKYVVNGTMTEFSSSIEEFEKQSKK